MVTAHSPGDRNVWISSIVKKIAVQVRKRVPEIIEREEIEHKLPVQDEAGENKRHPRGNLKDSPPRIKPAAPCDLFENDLRVISEITEKSVGPRAFGRAVFTVAIDGKPVH